MNAKVNIDPALMEIIVCPQCHGDLAVAAGPEGGR